MSPLAMTLSLPQACTEAAFSVFASVFLVTVCWDLQEDTHVPPCLQPPPRRLRSWRVSCLWWLLPCASRCHISPLPKGSRLTPDSGTLSPLTGSGGDMRLWSVRLLYCYKGERDTLSCSLDLAFGFIIFTLNLPSFEERLPPSSSFHSKLLFNRK